MYYYASWFSSETLALYKSLTYLLTYLFKLRIFGLCRREDTLWRRTPCVICRAAKEKLVNKLTLFAAIIWVWGTRTGLGLEHIARWQKMPWWWPWPWPRKVLPKHELDRPTLIRCRDMAFWFIFQNSCRYRLSLFCSTVTESSAVRLADLEK